MGKIAGAVGGLGSEAAVIATVGWPGVAMMVTLIALPLAGMLWVLNNLERCQRLVLVITAVRGGAGPAATPAELPIPPKTPVPRGAEREPEPTAEPAEVPRNVDCGVPLGFRRFRRPDAATRRGSVLLGPGVLDSADIGLGESDRGVGENLAAMITQRSLAAMSAIAGSVLLVHQGAAWRRSAASLGWCPCVAYQSSTIV